MEGKIEDSKGSQVPSQDVKLAPFNPTSKETVDAIFTTIAVRSDDVLVDLGCGDGRVLAAASQAAGCRGIGYEYDEGIASKAKKLIEDSGLTHLVAIFHQSALEAELKDANIVFVYLVPSGLEIMREKLLQAYKAGAVIVSNMFAALPAIEPLHVHKTRHGLKLYFYGPKDRLRTQNVTDE